MIWTTEDKINYQRTLETLKLALDYKFKYNVDLGIDIISDYNQLKSLVDKNRTDDENLNQHNKGKVLRTIKCLLSSK